MVIAFEEPQRGNGVIHEDVSDARIRRRPTRNPWVEFDEDGVDLLVIPRSETVLGEGPATMHARHDGMCRGQDCGPEGYADISENLNQI